MQTVKLAALKRDQFGTAKVRAIRRAGRVPGILYGHGMKPLALDVDKKQFKSALHTKAGENVVLDLQIDGVKLKESTCLIKEIQVNPVTDMIEHIDFTVISMTEKIRVKVQLHAKNQDIAVGVKEGGVLDIVHHEIEVECLPSAIPESIEVDAKDMKINDAVHAKDLHLPKDVVCTLDPEEVIVAVHPPAKEELPATGEEPTQPEVIEKGKKLEEGEEGEAKAEPKAPAAEKKQEKK